MISPLEILNLKKTLRNVWHPFFGRFGRINPIQIAVIPHILTGKNVILSSPAASGKTEAIFAPLVERLICQGFKEGLQILYLAPTRALVNNIYYRLKDALRECGLSASIRTGDYPRYSLKHPEQVLFTTPESFDSMLCRYPSIWKSLKAIILDEIHLIDGNYRGDQLRILLERIRQEHATSPLQYAALSATLYDPKGTAQRYFTPVTSIKLGDPRPVSLHLFSALADLISFIKQERMHKLLIFANSRRDVERLGTELKDLWPPERIVVHHSSLSKQVRASAERALREWHWGICIATSTLEIGIDIGDFDGVMCYHPPPTPSSFQQRIGRGCRRADTIKALGYFANEAEWSCFQLYADMASLGEIEPLEYEPDLSVIVQQLFSYLFCHPRGAQMATLERLFRPLANSFQLKAILDHLIELGHITFRQERFYATGKLMDMAERGLIHSNIPTQREYRVIDIDTGKQMGAMGISAVPGTIFVLGGRVWQVVAVKGLNLHVRNIAQTPEFKHFTKKSSSGAFYSFLPKSLQLMG
jgi:ATP-dependent Lhr-like helicase